MKEENRTLCTCLICNQQWNSRILHPIKCPRCKSILWDKGDNLPCACCNKTLMIPYIHHIDGNHKNNNPNNKVAVCNYCHIAIHSNICLANRKQRITGTRRQNSKGINPLIQIKIKELKSKLR